MSQNGSWSQTANGSIEVSPIEVDLRSVSDAPPRRSVQFSDKVQRFPESAPSSPKPTDASPTSKNVNKTPLDIASESLKQDENVKKVEIPIQNSDQTKNGNKPQIDSFIDVKMEKQNNPDLKIEFNSPLSNSSINFDQQQQQSDKQNQQQQEKDNFKPTPDVLPSSLNQPPHVKNEDKNFNGDLDDKPFVTTVILNVEMVRTPKESDPEDDWDTDLVKLSFSTNSIGYDPKTNEKSEQMQEKANDNQSTVSNGTTTTSDHSQETKPPRSPQFGQSKEGWNQIDLSPLLNTVPSTDIANINAKLNRTSSVNEEESIEVNKEQKNNEDKEVKGDQAEIPVQFGGQSDVKPAETEANELVTTEVKSATTANDSNHASGIQFGIIPHKVIEIPIQFHADKPVTPVDIPLSEFGIPSESTTDIVIIFDTQETSSDENKSSVLSFGTIPHKEIEIPIQHEGHPPIQKIDIPLSDFGFPLETNIEIAINFVSDVPTNPSENNETAQKGLIEIPIQFEGQPTVVKVDIPLSQYGTPPITHFEIPIIFAENDVSTSKNYAKTSDAGITVVEIPIHFEGQEAPNSAEHNKYIPASETSTEIQIIFENQNKDAQNADKNVSTGNLGIEIPIQFEGQPNVAKVDVPLSEYGTPAISIIEIPIIFSNDKRDSKDEPNEEETTEIAVVQFGFTAQKQDENANATTISEPSNISEIKQDETSAVKSGIPDEKTPDKDASGEKMFKVFEIPIQFEGQPEVQKIDVPLSEYGTPAETREEIIIIFETPEEINQQNAIKAVPTEKSQNDENESKNEQNENNVFGILPFKVFEIAVQHEGKPAVEKVDIPLSEFGMPSESAVEIMIIFEEQKADNEEKEKVEHQKPDETTVDKNEKNEQQNDGTNNQNVTEIPINNFSQENQETVEKPNIQPENVQEKSQQPKEQQKSESKEVETVTEIPVIFEKTSNNEQAGPTAQQPSQENEKASSEGGTVIPITVERMPEQKSETDVQPNNATTKQSSILQNESQNALNQEQTAALGKDEGEETTIPITIQKAAEQPSQPTSIEKTADSSVNKHEQKIDNNGDTIYQTSFAKPMVDESTLSQKQENAERVPEANDIQYQNTFAQPLSTEKKEEIPEEKSDHVNYQSSFGQKSSNENQQKTETKSSNDTNSWNRTPEDKSTKEAQDQKQETVIPVKIETQQQFSSTTPQAESEANKWNNYTPQIDDKIESNLFSAPSPVNDDDFWIEVPASGVVHQIPISIQKTDSPANAAQQNSSIPPSQNHQASNNETSSFQDKKHETISPSSEGKDQQKSTKESETVYNEVSQGGEQQKQQQPSRGQDSFGNQANDFKPVDTSNKIEDKSSNDISKPLDSVKSPTKKFDDNSIELNIQEYEEQLRKNTQEALNLVDKLCESSNQQQQERHAKRDREREYERRSSQSPTNRDRSRSHSVQFNESQLEAQSYRVNPDLLQEPTSALLLPDFRLALADYQFGLSIFNLHTKDLKRVEGGNKWRRPHNMIYLHWAKQFLVLCEYSEKEDGNYQLFVCRFSSDLEYINRVEAPIFIRDKEILTFRMAYCHRTDCLYLAASTFNTGYIYELAPDGFWREVYTGRNKTFIDISVFAVIGPVTELMLVDTSKDYIVVVSIYNSEAADQRRVAACEKPSALTIDEKGTVIIYDRCSCKVGIHSRLDNLRVHDIALVDHPKCQLSAWDRLLAVLIPNKKDLRLYKY